MIKAIHQKIESAGEIKTLCGISSVKINITEDIYSVTCIKCLQKRHPCFSFKYELNKEDKRYKYTIKCGEKLVGSVVFVPGASGFTPFILDLKIVPEFQGVGWGKFLVKQLQLINGPPIQLKSEPFGNNEGIISQKDLKAFYEMLGFVELQGSNHQMIWYPNSNIGDSHVVCVRIKPRSFKAYVQEHPEIHGEGVTYYEAVGVLVSKHKSFFKISLVDVWS